MTAARELATGALIAGKYRIEYVLGRGGMGAVYLATNEDIGRRVAIKVLLDDVAGDETLLHRFRQEARTAAAIGHPGIVDVFDLGTTAEGSPFIVMEALDGMTLGARMSRERRMGVADSIAIIAEVLDALAAAHDKDILHRDLKPDNLFLVARPVACVKILDFGISKLGTEDNVSLTRTGVIFGTPLYMSAEQARGAKFVTAASDLYSIGAILYQMLGGRTPFVGDSYNELVAALMNGPYTSIGELRKDLPAALVTLVDRMLSRDPAERPASVRATRTQLLEISRALAPAAVVDETAATMPPPAPAPAISEVPPTAPTVAATAISIAAVTPRARRGGAWIGGGAVIAVALGIAGVALRGGSHDDAAQVAQAGDARAIQPPPAPAAADAVPDAALVTPPDAPRSVAHTIPQVVVFRLHAEPPGTRWALDGDAVGDCNPCNVTGILGERHNVSASAPGYLPIHKPIVFDHNGTLELSLTLYTVTDPGVPEAAVRGINTIDRSNPFSDAGR